MVQSWWIDLLDCSQSNLYVFRFVVGKLSQGNKLQRETLSSFWASVAAWHLFYFIPHFIIIFARRRWRRRKLKTPPSPRHIKNIFMQHFYDFRLAASATAATTQRDKGCNGLRSWRQQRHLLHLLSIKWHFPWLPACLPAVFIPPSVSSLTSPSSFPFSTWSSCGSCNAAYFSLRLKCCFPSLRNSNRNCKWENGRKTFWNGATGGGWVENDVSHTLLGVLMGHRFAPLSHIINH